jgi:hypothetical protein
MKTEHCVTCGADADKCRCGDFVSDAPVTAEDTARLDKYDAEHPRGDIFGQ